MSTVHIQLTRTSYPYLVPQHATEPLQEMVPYRQPLGGYLRPPDAGWSLLDNLAARVYLHSAACFFEALASQLVLLHERRFSALGGPGGVWSCNLGRRMCEPVV